MSRPSSQAAHVLSGSLLEDPAENRPSIMADSGGFDWEDMMEAANRTPDIAAPMPLDHPEREAAQGGRARQAISFDGPVEVRVDLRVVHACPTNQRLLPTPCGVAKRFQQGDVVVAVHKLVSEDPPMGIRVVRSQPAILDGGMSTLAVLSVLTGDSVEQSCLRYN
jgi:hypothetical protein